MPCWSAISSAPSPSATVHSGGHPWIDHAPAQRRGEHLLMARGEGPLGLAQHIGRPAHRLHTARHRDMRIAVRNGAGRLDDRLQTGPAQPVHGHAGHGHRQPGEEYRHPRHIAVVLARAVRVAEADVVDPRRIEVRGAVDQGLDHMGGEIVGPDAGQRAAVLADGGPYGVDDVHIPYAWVGHQALSSLSRFDGRRAVRRSPPADHESLPAAARCQRGSRSPCPGRRGRCAAHDPVPVPPGCSERVGA